MFMLKSLFWEKVKAPLTVILAARETGAAAAFVLFSSTFPKIPLPSILCVMVPFNTILPAPLYSPELYTSFAAVIIFPLSFRVPRTSLKLSLTLMVFCEPARFTLTPAGLLIVNLFKDRAVLKLIVKS